MSRTPAPTLPPVATPDPLGGAVDLPGAMALPSLGPITEADLDALVTAAQLSARRAMDAAACGTPYDYRRARSAEESLDGLLASLVARCGPPTGPTAAERAAAAADHDRRYAAAVAAMDALAGVRPRS